MNDDIRTQMTFDAQKKSAGVSYLLWFFLGGFGAHRFYLGQTGTAATQLILFLLGWLTIWILGLGLLLLIPLGIWLLVDAFLIPGIVRQENMKIVDMLSRGPTAEPQITRPQPDPAA